MNIKYNRLAAGTRINRLVQEMIADHEEHTAISEAEEYPLSYWLAELGNAEDNA